MRFIIIDSDYPSFLKSFYSQHPALENQCYEQQARTRAKSCFGQADFYSENLRKIGHEAWTIHDNNFFLQHAWAREHGLKAGGEWGWEFRLRRGVMPWFSRIKDPWVYEIMAQQIKQFKPDVVVNYDMHLKASFFREVKPYIRLLIGNHAAPLPGERDFSVYDLVLSIVDNFVDYFRKQGVQSELLRLGFEPRVLQEIGEPRRAIPVLFSGNLHPAHASRIKWLEHICRTVPVEVRAPLPVKLLPGSPIRGFLRDPAWGVEMYQTLRDALMTLNHHIDVAEAYAGNVRLFEATGVGTLLITDWKKNLHEMFEPGKEVVAYRTPEECLEMIQYYLNHENERQAIASAGQRRTLRDHTYRQRMEQLASIAKKYLRTTHSAYERPKTNLQSTNAGLTN